MRLFAILLFAMSSLAQQEQLGTLSGVVVNSATGEPVKRASVQVMRISREYIRRGDQPVKPPEVRTAFTDASGSFRFDALPAGDYSCTARKPQFTAAFNESCKAPSSNIRIALSPLGVISGRVLDQDGLPLRNVNIVAISTHVQDGLRVKNTDRTVSTDDRGMYRLWNLNPGKYFIKAAGFAAGTTSYVGDISPQTGDESFPAVYFGGSRTVDSATALEVKPGEEAVADMNLTVEHAYRVRGTLSHLTPRVPVKFELISNGDASPAQTTLNTDTGKFELGNVAAGSYTLLARQGQAVAEAPVSVTGGDVDGLILNLEQPVDIPVTVRYTNEAPSVGSDVSDDAGRREMMRFANCGVQLRAEDGTAHMLLKDMAVSAVPPGRYRASINCFGAYPRSAMYGSQDLMLNPWFNLSPATRLPIDITATHGGGGVNGSVSGNDSQLRFIVLFPQTGGEPYAIVTAPSTDFNIENVAPGAYTAYALTQDAEFRNPDFVRTLTGGTPVQVEEGKEQKIEIPGVVR